MVELFLLSLCSLGLVLCVQAWAAGRENRVSGPRRPRSADLARPSKLRV